MVTPGGDGGVDVRDGRRKLRHRRLLLRGKLYGGSRSGDKELLKLYEIARLRCVDKRLHKSLMVLGADAAVTIAREMHPRTGDELPGIGLARAEHLRDLPMRVVERFAEHVSSALDGRQLLEQHQRALREGVASLNTQRRISAYIDCMEHRCANMRLTAGSSRLDDVDRKSSRRGREEGRRIPHGVAVGFLPADPRILHDVIGFRCASDDPVGDAEQPRTNRVERLDIRL